MNEEFDFSNFDANSVDTSYTGDSAPVPAGTYEAMIVNSEMKRTAAGTGSYLALSFQIVSGPNARRMFWTNVNLVNPSEKAREIGRQTLAKIMKAVGRTRVQSHVELRNLPMLCEVTVRPAEGQYPARNEVRNFRPVDAAGVTTAPAPQQQFAVAPAPAPQPPAVAVQTPVVSAAPVVPPTPAPAGAVPWAR